MSDCRAESALLSSPLRQVHVRYRVPGHARFELPATLRTPERADCLVQALLGIEGVYRVDFYRSQGKLSVRYQTACCSFGAIAQGLAAGIEQILANPPAGTHAIAPGSGLALDGTPASWIKAKYQEAKETFAAAQVLAERGFFGHKAATPAQRERFILEFCTDILVLYLIKTHWQAITTQWMRAPWRHRYDWLAVFYLIFLLVRWRRPKR